MKKRWLSRTLAAVVAGIMTVGMLAGCGQQKSKKTEESKVSSTPTSSEVKESSVQESSTEVVDDGKISYPVDTDQEISIFVYNGVVLADDYICADDSPWHSGLEEKTGVSVDWQFPAKGTDAKTALNLIWQEPDLPTIIYGNNVSLSNTTSWLNNERIIDLTEYLPKYAPDYWEYIHRPENADEFNTTVTEDGRFLAVYSFTETDFPLVFSGPVIRKDWLDECGLQVPRTLDEWEEVLVVFKEKYNATFGSAYSRLTACGISSGTGAMAVFGPKFYVDENKKVHLGAMGEEWKEMLGYLSRWYEKGLLDPDFATADDKTARAKALNGEIGISITSMAQLTNWVADAEAEKTGAEWIGIPLPVPNVGDPVTYQQIKGTRNLAYAAAITKGSSEEEIIAALQFLNYGYTEEGIMYHNFGEEGVAYTLDAEGNVVYTDLITKDPAGIDVALTRYTGMANGNLSALELEETVKLKNSQVSIEANAAWLENSEAKKYVMPTYIMTTEEKSVYSELYTPIGTFIEEQALSFAAGKQSLDKFDEYEANLYNMGLEDLLKVLQSAVDRYYAK